MSVRAGGTVHCSGEDSTLQDLEFHGATLCAHGANMLLTSSVIENPPTGVGLVVCDTARVEVHDVDIKGAQCGVSVQRDADGDDEDDDAEDESVGAQLVGTDLRILRAKDVGIYCHGRRARVHLKEARIYSAVEGIQRLLPVVDREPAAAARYGVLVHHMGVCELESTHIVGCATGGHARAHRLQMTGVSVTALEEGVSVAARKATITACNVTGGRNCAVACTLGPVTFTDCVLKSPRGHGVTVRWPAQCVEVNTSRFEAGGACVFRHTARPRHTRCRIAVDADTMASLSPADVAAMERARPQRSKLLRAKRAAAVDGPLGPYR